LDKEFFNILIFGQKSSKVRHLRIPKKTFKVGVYLLGFVLLSTIFFLCDYVQIKKRGLELSKLRQETHAQRSQIHFFSARIEDLEKQLSKLKEFDKKIRIIANLEKGQEVIPFMGMGGPSPSDIREKLKDEKGEKGLLQQMKTDVERLQSEAMSREESLTELEKLLEAKKDILTHTPSVWPTLGWLTSGFGYRSNPFTGLSQMHEGVDVSNRIGTPVVAPADGIITDSGNDLALGKALVISHGFGMTTRYGHLSKILVKVGQRVKRGEVIGEVGMTGKTTGPHLHYEVRLNGIPVNPLKYALN
jgi:murein DD-endopeptidase MepM/ murein hydrolase activator NlpD